MLEKFQHFDISKVNDKICVLDEDRWVPSLDMSLLSGKVTGGADDVLQGLT
jgi:hypothetical protein